jgi:hypothetical protein
MTARAALSMTRALALMMSYTLRMLAGVVMTPGMFRADFTTLAFRPSVMTTALPCTPAADRKPAKVLVLGSAISRLSTTMMAPF